MNDEAVCRTAPATPGLSKMVTTVAVVVVDMITGGASNGPEKKHQQ